MNEQPTTSVTLPIIIDDKLKMLSAAYAKLNAALMQLEDREAADYRARDTIYVSDKVGESATNYAWEKLMDARQNYDDAQDEFIEAARAAAAAYSSLGIPF